MTDIVLHLVTLIAAFFQSVTGIGFGMIAGPVVLVVMNDPGAVMISTCMSWLIALVLFPMLRRGTNMRMLGRLTAGALLGLPTGLLALSLADIETLKFGAGLVIAILTGLMIHGVPGMARPGLSGDLVFGALGGAFGGCLAMPGPTAALRLSALGHDKRTVRATMVSFFCTIWPLIFLGQGLSIGFSADTLWNAVLLVPATLTGLLIGNWAAGRVPEALFRRLVIVFLLATSLSLLSASAWTWIGEM